MNSSFSTTPVQKIRSPEIENTDDFVAVEEPLEIRISFLDEQKKRVMQPLSVTMRTPAPGEDIELATGFLLTEGIIQDIQDIQKTLQINDHIVLMELSDYVRPELHKLERHFYTSSSCGVCGKTSIDAVKTICPVQKPLSNFPPITPSIIYSLPSRLNEKQRTFATTGGLHAAALFNMKGEVLLIKEDVGRHNALDKLIGSVLFSGIQDLHDHILLLSGRASFELIQKATMAGIAFVCAVGAPSSLAIQLAKERQMTLIGFLRDKRFNLYCGEERVNLKVESI